jgi:IS5 family transposase
VSAGLPVLADAGYDGAGPAIHIPAKTRRNHPPLSINARTRNMLLRSVRCRGERGFALLKGRWRTLKRVTASAGKTGDITRAALVLTHFEHGYLRWKSLRSPQ